MPQSQEDLDDSDLDSDNEDSPDAFTSSRMGALSSNTYARMERMRINQKRAQRERRLAEMGPKLEILKHMPFVVPFETRVNIFRQFIALDRSERSGRAARDERMLMPFGPMLPSARHHAEIRRGKTFEDAFENFYQLGDGLKDTISITFVDQFGAPEAGIDGGGVTKEFLTSVTTEAFSHDENSLRMFICNEKGLLFPDPIAVDGLRERMRSRGLTELDPDWKDTISKLLKRFEFLGRIVGKCLYEGILVDLAFAGFFLLQWPSTGSGESNTYKGSVNDLRDMDEDLYKGMLRLKNYPGDVSDLGIDFTINDQVSPPGQPLKTTTRNLMPNGDKTLVTNDNRLLYISYVARHRLVIQPALQTSAFLRGLRQIIRPSWLSMFNQSELQRLVGGDSSEIDIEDLRRNTVYGGVYVIGDDNEEHPTIKLFWKVMKGFTDTQRRDVLKYVSSTPRAPLLGFSQLKPKFSIRDAGRDESRLPSTSTCVNLLKLPQYTSEATMRDKLLYAITSGAGFDLS
ncbi:ubiquitin-protein ligase (E3) [Amphichorda felina]